MTRSAHPRRALAVAVVTAALVALVVTPASADYDPPPGYPTWDEVQAAMSSEEAKAHEVTVVQAALVRAQSDAAVAAQKAVDTASAERQAQADLQAATDRLNSFDAQLTTAKEEAAKTHDALGRVVAAREREIGSGSVAVQLLGAQDPDTFMDALMTSDLLSNVLQRNVSAARTAADAVQSLTDQAGVARTEREKLEVAAKQAADEAADASQKADAAVATAQSTSDILYAQLATLKSSTADVQKRYNLGQQVAAEAAELERQREAAAAAAAAASSGGPVYSGDVTVDVAAAQAYARGAIGAYGWGDGQFGCLVNLWNGESGWRANATNPDSGAYGIPQSWPASKMATAGPDWRTNANTQIDWGLAYIDAAYGSPCTAWDTWNSRWPHWY